MKPRTPESSRASQPSEDARERILETAHRLFRESGMQAAGVDRIVGEAGVAKATLYTHFGSKDELVLAVLDRHEQVWTRAWLQAEIERRATAPSERLLAIFDAFDGWFHQPDYAGCLFTSIFLEANGTSSRIEAEAAARLAAVHALVRRLAEEAGIRDADRFARRWQMLMLGSIVAAVAGNLDAAKEARDVASLLLEEELPSGADS